MKEIGVAETRFETLQKWLKTVHAAVCVSLHVAAGLVETCETV